MTSPLQTSTIRGTRSFKNNSGEDYFQSGKAKWKLYQIDKWTHDGPSKLYHQDKMVELLPSENN